MPLKRKHFAQVKERSPADLLFDMGETETRSLADDHLISSVSEGFIPYLRRTAKIAYTEQLGRNGLANQCTHTQFTRAMSTVGTVYRVDQPSSGVYYLTRNPHRLAWDNHPTAENAAYASFGVNLGGAYLGAQSQGLINAYIRKRRPDLTTVSVPNFLADIDDIKTLMNLWRTSKSVGKNLAGGYLNYKFGWKPTIGDVQQMIGAISNFQEKIREFEKSLDKVFKFFDVIGGQTIATSGTVNLPGISGTLYWSARIKQHVSAGIAYRCVPSNLACMGYVEKTLRGFLDSLGFQLNPRIVWDALPFTFIVDWFLNIGAWLENFSIDTLELPIVLEDSYLQYKEEVVIESHVIADEYHPTIPVSTRCPEVVTSTKYFQRMPIAPDPLSLSEVGWRNPSKNQWLLLAALAEVILVGEKHKRGIQITVPNLLSGIQI